MNEFCFNGSSIKLGEKTYVMGILNVTPDSFSDGGKYNDLNEALKVATKMETAGVDFIDIGGQSTRPGYTAICAEDEWNRLKIILPSLLRNVKVPVSVDTYYPYVAERALDMGCAVINDVSGRVNFEMAETVKKYGAGWVLMHASKENSDDIVKCVHNRLVSMKKEAISLGINEKNLCLDPGIGFEKTMEQNRELIKCTQNVKVEGTAYLLGASRKRVIGQALRKEIPFNERDAGTVAAHTIGIMGGADIIRVHDFCSACQAAAVADYIIKP